MSLGLGVRAGIAQNSGFQPSCTPTWAEVLPSLDPNCPTCKMGVVVDGMISVMEA